jgi:hypothetical protein
MALPSIGGGYQIGDGNLNEIILGESPVPATATATATLTVAQITSSILIGNPSTTAATYTLPTSAAVDAVMSNAKIGSTFELTVINQGTSTGLITMAMGTGMTGVGNLIVPIAGSAAGACNTAIFVFRKTGDGAYTVYRVA